MNTPEAFSQKKLFADIRSAIPADYQVYLVGGAVRDRLLRRSTYDLDFVVSKDALKIGKRVADYLGAAYYPLDEDRETARVIIIEDSGNRQILDFALFRGTDIESDLIARDFTVNAMAFALHDNESLVDPLGGVRDLHAKVLRACSDESFIDDPLRILRAIRQASALGFRIQPGTIQLMRQAAQFLPGISSERIRDEFFRTLESPRPSGAIRVMDNLNVLQFVLPELEDEKSVAQSPPHIYDVWDHSLEVVNSLERVLNVLAQQHNPEGAASWALGFISVSLGRYRELISEHLAESLSIGRSIRSLLYLAALYHDAGKPYTSTFDAQGRIRFFEHDIAGSEIISKRGRALRLSKEEVDYISRIVRHHMRPLHLTNTKNTPSRRATYRFFRDTGPSGVDICLLSLADTLATYGPTLPKDLWAAQLLVVRTLFEAWWDRAEEQIDPAPIINGKDLIENLSISPGPRIGALLELIREAQVTGQVDNRDQAMVIAREWLGKQESDND